MSTLTIHLFGGFQLTYNGNPLTTIAQTRQQSLLAYLLLHRQKPQSRQHLAFLFWPDSSEVQAQSNLRKSLHRLRQALLEADQFLGSDATTVRWQPTAPFVLDVAEFEQAGDLSKLRATLTQAVDLYAGDLPPEWYGDWILPQRERLRERFLCRGRRSLRQSAARHERRFGR